MSRHALRTLVGALVVLALAPAVAEAKPDSLARYPLRLTDLGPGYRLDDDPGCQYGPTYEGSTTTLRRFNDRHRVYRGCETDFAESWRPPEIAVRPKLLNSVVIRFAKVADAKDAFRIGPHFADYHLGVGPKTLKRLTASRSVGTQFRLYSTRDALVEDTPSRSAVVAIWRTGRLLSLVLASGKPDAAGQETALRFAEIQQERILRPTPLPRGANDDRDVELDNPTIGPLYWLGRSARPGGLPRTVLSSALVGNEIPGPGFVAMLDYTRGVELRTWRPEAWTRFLGNSTGRLVRTGKCATRTDIAIPNGTAVIYGGHERRQKRCGKRPDRYLAHVYLPGVVVAVNVPDCTFCVARGGKDPYDSLRGMKAVVRALKLRPRRGT